MLSFNDYSDQDTTIVDIKESDIDTYNKNIEGKKISFYNKYGSEIYSYDLITYHNEDKIINELYFLNKDIPHRIRREIAIKLFEEYGEDVPKEQLEIAITSYIIREF